MRELKMNSIKESVVYLRLNLPVIHIEIALFKLWNLILCWLFILLIPGVLFSQVYSGEVIDQKTCQPVPFANIGIAGKNVGTVSDEKGEFQIMLEPVYDQDSIYITCIGYEKKCCLVRTLKENKTSRDRLNIKLSPRTYMLDMVTIQPSNAKMYILGNFCEAGSTYGNSFYSDDLGAEMGVVLNLPRKVKKAQLRNFRFYVGKCTFSSFPVRMNVYSLKDGKPFENILKEPVSIEITGPGEYMIDLDKYNIVIHKDVFISLEYYQTIRKQDGELVFCAVHNRKQNSGNSFYRMTSQGNWQREMFDSVGFSVEVWGER
jgi:hypothetical protein